jgi:hypothetical protein
MSAPRPSVEFAHALHAGWRRVVLFDIDGRVGAKLLGQMQAVLQTIERDDFMSAHIRGHGHGVETQTARRP